MAGGERPAVELRASLARSIAVASAARTTPSPRIGCGFARSVGSRRLKSRCSRARDGVYAAGAQRGLGEEERVAAESEARIELAGLVDDLDRPVVHGTDVLDAGGGVVLDRSRVAIVEEEPSEAEVGGANGGSVLPARAVSQAET